MRILLANKFAYHRGGAERTFLDQLRWLRQAGHQVAVLSQGPTSLDRDTPDQVSLPSAELGGSWRHALPHVGRLFWSPQVSRATRALLESFRPDVALLHNVYHQLGPALIMTVARAQVPMVMTLHDQKVVCPAYSGLREGELCSDCSGGRFVSAALHGCGGSSVKGALLAAESLWQHRILRSYDHVSSFIVPSEYLRGRLREMGFRPPVELLRHGVEVEAEPALPWSERPYVGFAGRLSSEKGLDLLLAAARHLPRLRFRLAGTGPQQSELSGRIARDGIANVELLGHLDQPDLRREMRRWRVALVPSLMYENCPYAVLDALASRVPVIGADAGGIPELTSRSGVRFERGNVAELARVIEAVHADVPSLVRHASAGTDFVTQQCSPDRHLQRLLDILSAAAARVDPPRSSD